MLNIALILAGGTGQRMNVETPKQFLAFGGKPILVYTLEKFQNHCEIDAIIVCAHPDWVDTVESYKDTYSLDKIAYIVSGGATRHKSIINGLNKLYKHYDDNDIILVQDGVRPLTSNKLISECIADTKKYGTAFAVKESVVPILITDNGSESHNFLLKENAMQSLTPTSFKLKIGKGFYESVSNQYLDDYPGLGECMIAEGYSLHLVKSNAMNIKIAYPEDIPLMEIALRSEDI